MESVERLLHLTVNAHQTTRNQVLNPFPTNLRWTHTLRITSCQWTSHFKAKHGSIPPLRGGNISGSGDQISQMQHQGRCKILSGKTTYVLCVQRSCPLSSPAHINLHSPLSRRNIPRRNNKTIGHRRPGLDRLLLIILSRIIFPRRHRHSLFPLSPPRYTVLNWQNPLPRHHRISLQLRDGKFCQPPLHHSEEWLQGRFNRNQWDRWPTGVCGGSNQKTCCTSTTKWRQHLHITGGSIQKWKKVYD